MTADEMVTVARLADPNETEDGDLSIAFCPRDLEILIEILSVELSNAVARVRVLMRLRERGDRVENALAFLRERPGYETKNPPKGRGPKRSKIK